MLNSEGLRLVFQVLLFEFLGVKYTQRLVRALLIIFPNISDGSLRTKFAITTRWQRAYSFSSCLSLLASEDGHALIGFLLVIERTSSALFFAKSADGGLAFFGLMQGGD